MVQRFVHSIAALFLFFGCCILSASPLILEEIPQNSQPGSILSSQESRGYGKFVHILKNGGHKGALKLYKKSKDKNVFHSWLEQFSIDTRDALMDGKERESHLLLFVLRVINSFHEVNRDLRFKVLTHLRARDLYTLIHIFRDAIYTSSYNAVIDDLLSKLDSEKTSIYEMLMDTRFTGWNRFLEAANAYNRAHEILARFKPLRKIQMMQSFLAKALQKDRKHDFIAFVEILHSSQDQALRKSMLSHLENESRLYCHQRDFLDVRKSGSYCQQLRVMVHSYQQFLDQDLELKILKEKRRRIEDHEIDLDETMPAYLASKDSNFQVAEAPKLEGLEEEVRLEGDLAAIKMDLDWWARFIRSQEEGVELKSFLKLSSRKFVRKDSVHYQRHYFFNDQDGRTTFYFFKKLYDNDPLWKFEETENYIKIHSTNTLVGNSLVLFANKPERVEEADIEIKEILKNANASIETFVYRGHSYKLKHCIEDIDKNVDLAVIGSCGGFEDMEKVMKLSKGAHIILSKGTGTIWVNNILLKELNELLVNGEVIYWPEFRERLRKKIIKFIGHRDILPKVLETFDRFYILPHENIGLAMIQKFHELEQDAQLIRENPRGF